MNKKPNLAAIEIYSEKVADAICDDFFSENDYITGIQITKLTEIESVNLFVLKRIFENWQKEAIRIQSPYFDYSSEAVRSSLSHLMNALSKNIHISKIHFLPLLQKAVRDVLILTFSPDIFFEEFFGVQGMKIPLKNYLIPMFGYIKIHPKLTKEVQDAIEEEAGINIKRTEAINIANNIIRKHPELQDSPKEIVASFNEIVPVGLFELHPSYLDEAPSEDLIAETKSEIEETPKVDIETFSTTVVNIDDTINETIEEKEEVEEESPVQEETLENKTEVDTNEVTFETPTFEEPTFESEVVTEEEAVVESEPESESMDDLIAGSLESFSEDEVKEDNLDDFIGGIEEISFDSEPEIEEKVEEPAPVVDETPETEVREEVTAVVSEPEVVQEDVTSKILEAHVADEEPQNLLQKLQGDAAASENNIKDSININQKFLFQKELFGGNPDVMNLAVERLDACEDYTSAISLIKSDYAVKYEWDFTSEAVVSFISLVDNKF
ncbi:hypothetical protein [Flammeovirga agarivorans]|uniref:Uncharacterized protein n=1 Tax=Flammeovirga agarivorans TaxID=2726742 RepID=A0A7X8XUK7_9BACT|nr:hypothetical protein [Flammeovirga agarivorans]NLR90467.1 hypothetical protein [Flammeovirga agarivorans]